MARTTPNICHLLKPLEHLIKETFLPSIVGKIFIEDYFREVSSLPAKFGGLGIPNITEMADQEYANSLLITEQLSTAIINQVTVLKLDTVKENKR